MRRKLILAPVLMTPVVVVSRCNHTRIPGALVIHTSHRVLRTQSFSKAKSIVAHHARVHDIFGIFSRKGKSCCHVDSRRHNVYTIQSDQKTPIDRTKGNYLL